MDKTPTITSTGDIKINFLSCHKCGRRTEVKQGFIYGVTLRKDPLYPGAYICEKHTEEDKLPWRIKKPAEFRDLLSSLGNTNRGKKKIMNKMRKVRA